MAALPAAAEPAGPSAPAPAKPSAAERVHAEARRILGEMKDSRYSHKTRVDEEEGSYELDCSGFVTVVLKAAAPRPLASVPHAARRKRPLAFEFHDAFAAAPTEETGAKGWRRVERLADARPGDLIAWRREEIKPGEDTGHIVIVDAAPVREDDGQFRVVVLDSTGRPHGDDTRQSGATGVGRGTIWLTVDDAGRPSGFRWRARDGALNRHPIAIGRAVEAGDAEERGGARTPPPQAPEPSAKTAGPDDVHGGGVDEVPVHYETQAEFFARLNPRPEAGEEKVDKAVRKEWHGRTLLGLGRLRKITVPYMPPGDAGESRRVTIPQIRKALTEYALVDYERFFSSTHVPAGTCVTIEYEDGTSGWVSMYGGIPWIASLRKGGRAGRYGLEKIPERGAVPEPVSPPR